MKQAVRRLLGWLGYRIEGTRFTPRQLFDAGALRQLEFDDVICRHLIEHGEDVVFLQVGAYDGVSTDPLRKYIARFGWRGVMVEPQPGPAGRLRALYGEGSGVTVIEAAVDREPGTRSLFTVESDAVPVWAGGMASFDRDHILKHDYLIPGIADMVRELKVPAITFDEVLAKLPAGQLDLLQIDVEGADLEILSMFPFARIRPAIIQWEVKNLSTAQREAAIDLLRRHNYRVAPSGDEDMLAIREGGA